ESRPLLARNTEALAFMSAVFADTFYFLARLNPNDAAHGKAVQFGSDDARPIVTTGWILTEVADAMAEPVNRSAFLRLVSLLRSSSDVEIIPCSPELFDRGIEF